MTSTTSGNIHYYQTPYGQIHSTAESAEANMREYRRQMDELLRMYPHHNPYAPPPSMERTYQEYMMRAQRKAEYDLMMAGRSPYPPEYDPLYGTYSPGQPPVKDPDALDFDRLIKREPINLKQDN